jgi:transposase
VICPPLWYTLGMVADAASLPREPDILIGMIVELRDENSRLLAMLETMRRTLYGARSEKLDSGMAQLPLDLPDVSTAPVELTTTTKPVIRGSSSRPKAARNIGSLPKHLLREDVVIEPGIKACPCCQGSLHLIGEDVSEMLDVVPAIIKVKRIRRPRYGCRRCESAVVQAPAPAARRRRWPADDGVTRPCRRVEVCLALATQPPGSDVGRSRDHARPLHPGALDREGGMVAATAAFPPARDRDVSAEGLL